MTDAELEGGEPAGKFVVLRDVAGRYHLVTAEPPTAVCETDEGVLLMLPGGKLVCVPRSLAAGMGCLSGRR